MNTGTRRPPRPWTTKPKRVVTYSFLAILTVAVLALVTSMLRRPQPAVLIDTQIESGRHLTFVLVAQHVAPGTEPYAPYVALVRAARDSLRALAAREGIYYSTVGVAQHWDIAEGLRVLNAYGRFDEVSVGRSWFNTGRFRYRGRSVPGVLVFLEDISVGQTSWTSLGLTEVARFEYHRSMREWAARGFSLNLDLPGTEGPNPPASLSPPDDPPSAPITQESVVMQSVNPDPAIWQLDPNVLASTGGTQTDPLYRVVGAALSERHLIVAEASTGRLRFYNHDGRLDETVGREGQGPGEYRSMAWMHRVRDEVHAYDRSDRRVEVYSLDGSRVRSIAVRPHDEVPSVVGSFADGSLLAVGSANPLYVPDQAETRRLPMTLVRHDLGGAPADRLFDIVGPERYFQPWGRGGVRQISRLFGRATGVGVVDSTFVVMDNESYAISVYNQDGVHLETLLPDPVPPPTPIGQSDIESARERMLADADERRERFVEGMLRTTGFPDHLPPYGWLSLEQGDRRPPLIVADGFVFALRYGGVESASGEVAGPEWFVFRHGEGHVATMESGDDVRLLDLKGDLAAVLRRTELGEEIVELRRVAGR